MADEGNDEAAAVFPQFQEILPVNLYQEQPEGEPGLGAALQAGYQPFQVMFPVQKLLHIKNRSKFDPVSNVSCGLRASRRETAYP